MTCGVRAFSSQVEAGQRLARMLGIQQDVISAHRFPDGESLVRVPPSPATTLLYCSLDHPNEKLVELLLAAAALRENGSSRVVLVAPYLAYMRQDTAFHPGEAVSQRIIGELLAAHFDALLTIDPHLHRTHSLAAVMPGIEAVGLSAAPVLASALDGAEDPLLVGPDGEARQWVERIAKRKELEFVLGRKRRIGDRQVDLAIPDRERANGRRVVLVDDLLSTGATLVTAARLLRDAGAASIEVLATHCLASEDDLEHLHDAGIDSIRATDSVASPVATLHIADLLADEIRRRGWCQ